MLIKSISVGSVNTWFTGDHQTNNFGGSPTQNVYLRTTRTTRTRNGRARSNPGTADDESGSVASASESSATNATPRGGPVRRLAIDPHVATSPHVHSDLLPKGDPYFNPDLEWADQLDPAIEVSESDIALNARIAACSGSAYTDSVSKTALKISEYVQKARENREAFEPLGNDACRLAHHIIKTYEERKPLEKSLDEDIRILQSTMSEICLFIEQATTRSVWMSMLLSRWDKQKVLEYCETLSQSMSLFGVRSLALRQGGPELHSHEPTF